MHVELDQTLLTAAPREELALLAICAFGLAGRHRIVPDDRRNWERWAEGLPPDLADEVRLVWDEGERRVAEGTRSEWVRVAPVAATQFHTVPLVVEPGEALTLLGRPLRVLLENGRNDRSFMLAFADDAAKKVLREAEQEGWIVFETAGGIGEIVKRMETPDSEPREVFRTMYLCDSDAREPGQPSDNATFIQKKLADLTARYLRPSGHFGVVLARRAAENYAPPSEVLAWACDTFGNNRASGVIEQSKTQTGRATLVGQPGDSGSPKRRLLAAIALRELGADTRAFLDMKEGRHKKASDGGFAIRTIDLIWNQLDAFQQAALLNGLGASFSAEFYGTRVGLTDETGEITALIATILERL